MLHKTPSLNYFPHKHPTSVCKDDLLFVFLSFSVVESLHSAHNSCTFSSQSLPPLVRVVISSDHTESGDPSESGADVDGQDKDDCHTSKMSCWTAKKRKFKVETEEREDEEDDDDQIWPITGPGYREKMNSYFDSNLGEELNQTHTKKNSKKSSKKKRDDSADVSREFTFINHLGAYTGQFFEVVRNIYFDESL